MRKLHPNLGDAEAAMQPRLMIIGDFNQQRERDYTAEEWRQIRASKHRRRSPLDDGVPTILFWAGFRRAFDSIPRIGRSWLCDDPLPSTHWSRTVVDYTYFRGLGLKLDGVHYVSRIIEWWCAIGRSPNQVVPKSKNWSIVSMLSQNGLSLGQILLEGFDCACSAL